jgi:AAA family ATP:ADP antiporter
MATGHWSDRTETLESAGLLVQPLTVIFCSWGFMLQPTLSMIAVTKIGDRGLSYSINRASGELLYIPIDPVMVY